jgi:hypothetical protein
MDHWHDRFDFPELERDPLTENLLQINPPKEERPFLMKFKPKLCAKFGYVHLFPAFYKSCIIIDMEKYPKDWCELNLLPVANFIRKILVLVEGVGIIAYYVLHLINEGSPVFTLKFFIDLVVMTFGFTFINKLNL